MLTETAKKLSVKTGSYFAIRNSNIIFLPHSGSSFGFIGITFLLITRRHIHVLSSSACEIVEARVEAVRIVCVSVTSGVKCI